MCGIAGIKYKSGQGPLGRDLFEIMIGVAHRGPDSAGIGLYGERVPSDQVKVKVRINLPPSSEEYKTQSEKLFSGIKRMSGTIVDSKQFGDTYRLVIQYEKSIKSLANSLIKIKHVEVQSVGHLLEISKVVGAPTELEKQVGICSFIGSHGIAHTRLATESDILVSTSHPFWAYGFNDVAVVHNGQLTNYWRLRRWLETRRWRFTTENDTELIAVYIADKLDGGYGLRETLDQCLQDFDGTYSFLVSTKDQIGYAKDMLGAKPLVVADTEHYVALASEEVGIQRVLRDPNLKTYEPYPFQVQTW